MNTNRIILKSLYLLVFTIFNLNSLFAQNNLPLPDPCEICGAKFTHKNTYDIQITHKPGCKYSVAPTTNEKKPSQTVPNELKQINSLIDLLSPSNTDSKNSAEIEAEKKELAEKKAIEERIRLEKTNHLKAELKPIDNSHENKQKVLCLNAQKEVYRLLTLKIKFENQLFDLKKWSSDLDDLEKGFIDDKNAYTKGFSDDLLNLIPIDYIKKVTPVLQGEKIEKALTATKMLKSSVENLLELKENLDDTVINKMNLANQSYTYAGEMLEGASVFAGEKYSKIFEKAGKCLQMNGSSLGLVKDNSNENIANSVIDAVGLFVPPASLTAAGSRIALKTAYEIYSDWQIHKLSTTKSENLKAQEFLKSKIEELDNSISLNQAIVDEYKKSNPAGCPVY